MLQMLDKLVSSRTDNQAPNFVCFRVSHVILFAVEYDIEFFRKTSKVSKACVVQRLAGYCYRLLDLLEFLANRRVLWNENCRILLLLCESDILLPQINSADAGCSVVEKARDAGSRVDWRPEQSDPNII